MWFSDEACRFQVCETENKMRRDRAEAPGGAVRNFHTRAHDLTSELIRAERDSIIFNYY